MTIDFQQTRAAILDFKARLILDNDGEHQAADMMIGVCDDALKGQYEIDLDNTDAFSRSFIGWSKHRGLLKVAP